VKAAEVDDDRDGVVSLWARPLVWALRLLLGRPRDSALALVAGTAVAAIIINGLYLQPGPHPAPIFVFNRTPVTVEEATGAVALPRPRPLEAPQPEPLMPPRRSDTAVDPRPQAVASRPMVARKDPIADLLAGSTQLTAVQRALSDFGYGPLTPNGTYGPETRAAIERFEREHHLAVTGQVSDRLLRELSQLVGKPI
jgi:hypothetical protein